MSMLMEKWILTVLEVSKIKPMNQNDSLVLWKTMNFYAQILRG